MPTKPQSEKLDAQLEARFDALLRSHRAAFERLARRLARSPEEAEDLLQETLVDAYRAFGRFREGSHFYSWVARIMTNNYRDRIRRRQHALVSLERPADPDIPDTLELPDETSNPERILLEDQLDANLQSALDSLQPIHRATVMLCDLEGATYQEAAEAEACPVGTIRSRLHRAHAALRQFLSNLDPRHEEPAPAPRAHSRRAFLQRGAVAAAGAAFALPSAAEAAADEAIRVLVWSDGTASPEVYPQGIGGAIADGLRADRRLEVHTALLTDPHAGLDDETLRRTHVLIWWGAAAQEQVPPDRAAAVARLVRDGRLGLIALHSSHRSALMQALLGPDAAWEGDRVVDGSPVDVRVTAPRHPIAEGLAAFRIPRTERYEGELAGRRPEVVVFSGTYGSTGTTARQGMVWTIGRGRVFYFQPGHETFPIYYQEEVRQVLRNAVRWVAGR